jgi:hypothetical protein
MPYKNKEDRLMHDREYHYENSDERNWARKLRYEENQEQEKRRQKLWREAHPNYFKEWNQKVKEKKKNGLL